MRIPTLIVGGGIGGLSLARELSLRGLPATVLERAPRLDPVGAGIIMNPNAMAVLERNGLAEEVRRESWPYLTRETRDRDGRLLALRDYRPLYDSGRLARGALVHRAHLLDALYRGLPAGTVRFGVEAQAADIPEGGVVVGADGIHSQVRRELFGEVAPRYMGYRSHRLVMDNVAGVRCFTEYLGRGARVGLVPISATRLYVWTTFNSPREAPPPDPRGVFSQFGAEAVRRVRAALPPAEEIIVTEIEELTLERWTWGRAVLLGDAVHAMTPNIGQGAGMAMEDAAVLAEELAGAAEIEHALANYVRRRKARVETVMRISREVGEDGQRSGAFACWLRDQRVRREGRDSAKAQADLERLLAFSG
ncbi:MAG TPA: FAD-dependent monooxygenase [Burkholderiales bacterium]|nr:FAD-dependent monooxygenase [Burkholderiales bacterium]